MVGRFLEDQSTLGASPRVLIQKQELGRFGFINVSFKAAEAKQSKTGKALLDRNRQHNFSIGNAKQGSEFSTVSRQNFDYKGDPSALKGALEESRMKDLRGTHFTMGTHKSDFGTASRRN